MAALSLQLGRVVEGRELDSVDPLAPRVPTVPLLDFLNGPFFAKFTFPMYFF